MTEPITEPNLVLVKHGKVARMCELQTSFQRANRGKKRLNKWEAISDVLGVICLSASTVLVHIEDARSSSLQFALLILLMSCRPSMF